MTCPAAWSVFPSARRYLSFIGSDANRFMESGDYCIMAKGRKVRLRIYWKHLRDQAAMDFVCIGGARGQNFVMPPQSVMLVLMLM